MKIIKNRNNYFLYLFCALPVLFHKIISSSSINYKHKLKIHLNNKDEIVQAIHDMGVQFIVVESRNVSNLEIYDEFRDLLNDESRFKLHKSIEVESNIPL